MKPTRIESPSIVYSERLTPLTDHEGRLEREADVSLRVAPLWTERSIESNASSADIVMIGAVEPMTARALGSLRACRLLVRRGVGLDNIDVDAATDLGIPVAYVPDASVEEVSDHALALLLALERRVVSLDRFVQARTWSHATAEIAAERGGMRRLQSLTLGVVGLGRIGQALARKAMSVFGEAIGHDPFVIEAIPGLPLELVAFSELLARADLVSLHVPLTADTERMFDTKAFALMRPGSYIVNTARGGLIDEAALLGALRSGQIAGAGLDVTTDEPLEDSSPLLEMSSVVLTGHSAASGTAASSELRRLTVEAVLNAIRGLRPPALANPDVLESPLCRLWLDERGERTVK